VFRYKIEFDSKGDSQIYTNLYYIGNLNFFMGIISQGKKVLFQWFCQGIIERIQWKSGNFIFKKLSEPWAYVYTVVRKCYNTKLEVLQKQNGQLFSSLTMYCIFLFKHRYLLLFPFRRFWKLNVPTRLTVPRNPPQSQFRGAW